MPAIRMEENLCEVAFARIIQAIAGPAIQDLQVLRRGAVDEMEEPCCSIFGTKVVEDLRQVGTVDVEIELEWRSHYKDVTIEKHDRLSGAIRDVLLREDIIDLLNTAMEKESFTAIAWTRGPRVNTREGHSFVTKQVGTLMMFPWKST